VHTNIVFDGSLDERDVLFMGRGIEVLEAVDAYNTALLEAQGLTREQVMRHASQIPLQGIRPVRTKVGA
jgi:hypothetical protein